MGRRARIDVRTSHRSSDSHSVLEPFYFCGRPNKEFAILNSYCALAPKLGSGVVPVGDGCHNDTL